MTIHEQIAIMQEYARGLDPRKRRLENRNLYSDHWEAIATPSWNWQKFTYRIVNVEPWKPNNTKAYSAIVNKDEAQMWYDKGHRVDVTREGTNGKWETVYAPPASFRPLFDAQPWFFRVCFTKEIWDLMGAYKRGEKIEVAYKDGRPWMGGELWDARVCTIIDPTWDLTQYKYRLHDPYRELKDAHAAGKQIQIWNKSEFEWLDLPQGMRLLWSEPVNEYRVKPEDPYADLKAAYAAGKTIQIDDFTNGKWTDLPKPTWAYKPEFYRVKPEPTTEEIPRDRILGYHCHEGCQATHCMDPKVHSIVIRK